MSRLARALASALLLTLLLAGSTAAAQAPPSRVRVIGDQTTVWAPGFRTVATVVRAGTVLEVVRRESDWLEVVLPGSYGARSTGMIAVTRVEPVDGDTPLTASPTPAPPDGPAPGAPPSSGTRPRPVPRQPAVSAASAANPELQVFGFAGYGRFAARKSVEAVLGKAGAPWFGGGVRYTTAGGWFLEGALERFQGTGERVFVFEGEVFRLGVENRITITPLMGTGGYRFRSGPFSTYMGAGAGIYQFRETSAFAESADNVKTDRAAYRGVVGVQWPVSRRLAAGVEVLYTAVPNALSGGVAEAFDERDLGGLHVRGRLLFGN